MTDALVRLSEYRNAREQAAAELDRIKDALRQAGVTADTERGATDEGHPWVAFTRPGDGEMIAHVAVIDGQVVIDSPAFTRPLWGREIAPLLAQLLERLRLSGASSSPLSLALIACAVALAAAHLSGRQGAGWAPLDIERLPETTEAIGTIPALMVVRTAQAVQAAAEEPRQLPEQSTALPRASKVETTSLALETDGAPGYMPPDTRTGQVVPAEPASPVQIAGAVTPVDIPALLRKGDTVELVIGRGAETATQLVAATVKTAPQAWFDPREAAYATFRGETMASIARGDLVGSDVTTALDATEAYIRAQRAGVTKVEIDGKDVTLYTALEEPLQVYQFNDQSSITLVGVATVSTVAE